MDDHRNPNRKPNRSSANSKSRESESVSHYVDQLAMALGQLIPPERTILYIRALSDLSEQQLAFGFDRALKLFKPEYGRTFPAPAEIREWGFQWRPTAIDSAKAILERGAKPPDWEPLETADIERMRQESAAQAHEIRQAIDQAAEEHKIPPVKPLDPSEFEARRQRQLDAFRRKNKFQGEA